MSSPASPREFEELMELLQHIAPDRRGPVARFYFEAVDVCVICSEPVRRCDSRRRVEVDGIEAAETRLAHIPCLREDR